MGLAVTMMSKMTVTMTRWYMMNYVDDDDDDDDNAGRRSRRRRRRRGINMI